MAVRQAGALKGWRNSQITPTHWLVLFAVCLSSYLERNGDVGLQMVWLLSHSVGGTGWMRELGRETDEEMGASDGLNTGRNERWSSRCVS